MLVHEIFASIQGEGRDTGKPTIFIRLFGCNVHCSYCDQPQNKCDSVKMSIEKIINKVRTFKYIHNICITGGEPLIHKDVMSLVYELQSMGYKVSIETNGTIPLPPTNYRRSYRYVMDVKTPSSGVDTHNIYSNLQLLNHDDEVKFVIANREDYEFAKKVIKAYRIQGTVLFSPMFDTDQKPVIGADLVDWIIKDGLEVTVQLQIHKFLNVR